MLYVYTCSISCRFFKYFVLFIGIGCIYWRDLTPSLAGQTLSEKGESLVTLICAQQSGFLNVCDVVNTNAKCQKCNQQLRNYRAARRVHAMCNQQSVHNYYVLAHFNHSVGVPSYNGYEESYQRGCQGSWL